MVFPTEREENTDNKRYQDSWVTIWKKIKFEMFVTLSL
jgi:hypothetical protein